jgi:metacaspase-1
LATLSTAARKAVLDQFTQSLVQSQVPPSVRDKAVALLQAIYETGASASLLAAAPAAVATGTRRLVYVHGICAHQAGYSDGWWQALQPFVDNTFGAGTLGDTRLEVLWSDVVTGPTLAAAPLAAAAAPLAAAAAPARAQAALEIRQVLQDRLDRHTVDASAPHLASAAPQTFGDLSASIALPGVECVDDFTSYLVDDNVRQAVIDRFTSVVQPLLSNGSEIDIISHSWGTVVAYEGLRQLQQDGSTQPAVRNLFTVGAALSIAPVKSRLRPANQDGARPASVRRWVNLNARGDIVGGPLRGRPYQVDFDFPSLNPFGCGDFLGLVNPKCAHGSYFQAGNLPVNRDIFGAYIERP